MGRLASLARAGGGVAASPAVAQDRDPTFKVLSIHDDLRHTSGRQTSSQRAAARWQSRSRPTPPPQWQWWRCPRTGVRGRLLPPGHSQNQQTYRLTHERQRQRWIATAVDQVSGTTPTATRSRSACSRVERDRRGPGGARPGADADGRLRSPRRSPPPWSRPRPTPVATPEAGGSSPHPAPTPVPTTGGVLQRESDLQPRDEARAGRPHARRALVQRGER